MQPFRYDFVRYSAILYGLAWGIPAFVCLVSARGLTRGDPTAHRRATWASWALILINVPAIPISSAASIPVVLGSASAAVLLVTRRNLRRTDHQE